MVLRKYHFNGYNKEDIPFIKQNKRNPSPKALKIWAINTKELPSDPKAEEILKFAKKKSNCPNTAAVVAILSTFFPTNEST